MIAGSKILLVGGAGFIGSHIVDQLLGDKPAEIRILDNLVRGTKKNLSGRHGLAPNVKLIEGTMTDMAQLRAAVRGVDYVFDLAALWLANASPIRVPRSRSISSAPITSSKPAVRPASNGSCSPRLLRSMAMC